MDRMAMDAPAMMVAVFIAAFAAGATLGAVHFGALWWSIVLLREGRTLAGIAAQALRFVALAAALALIARQGAAPLLAAALGVLAARGFLMRRHRRLG
jgi:F1F0 ATPase subunit 2